MGLMTRLISPDGDEVIVTTAHAADYRDRGYTDVKDAQAPAASGDAKTIDDLAGKALDQAAETLAVEAWNPKAKVDVKRAALKESVAAKLAELDIDELTYESPIGDLIAAITAKTDQ